MRLTSFFLRVGLATVFLYAAIAAFLDPNAWIGFLPAFLRQWIPNAPLLTAFSVYELALALWLLTNWKTSLAATCAALTLAAIIITNIGAFDILFRDVAIFFAALALLTLDRQRKTFS